MSVIAAISSEALRSSLEQLIGKLELELVYPKQTGAALADPTKRTPGVHDFGDFASLNYYFSFTVKLTRPDPSQPLSLPVIELDDSGRIHLHNLGLALKKDATVQLALIFKQDNPFSLPFTLPFNLPFDIPIGSPFDLGAKLSSGSMVDVFRHPFQTDNLFSGLQTSLFGGSENGLELILDLPADLQLLEFSVHMKPAVAATTRKEKVTNPDGSETEVDVDCWGMTFDEFLVTGNPLAVAISLLELIFQPLKDAAVTVAEEGLVELLAKDPLFYFTHSSLDDIAEYLAACKEEADAIAEKAVADGLVTAAQGVLTVAEINLHAAEEAERLAKEADDNGLAPPGAYEYAQWQTGLARDAYREAQRRLGDAERNAQEAQQKIIDAQGHKASVEGKVKDAAREVVGPLVEGFFNLQEQGADFLLSLIDIVVDDLSELALDWFESALALFSGSDGLLAQLEAFLREKISFSLAHRSVAIDFSEKLPQALKDRLKVLPLEVEVPDQPNLTIQKKEFSLALDIGEVS